MKTLDALPAEAHNALRNLHPERLASLTAALAEVPEGSWFFVGTRQFRRVAGVLQVRIFYGPAGWAVPLSDEAALALAANFASVASRPAGRLKRTDFSLVSGGPR